MEIDNNRLEHALRETSVLRPPQQTLQTFGATSIHYYLLTVPTYIDIAANIEETVIREGQVTAERPRIVTPYYMLNLEGSGRYARSYLEKIAREEGPSSPGLLYRYRNEDKGLTIVSEPLSQLAVKLTEKLDKEGMHLASIIKGVDDLWDVSLLKFIHELTIRSLRNNLFEMGTKGLVNVDPTGVPADARLRIEEMFRLVRAGELEPARLKAEIDAWGLWIEYEDKFLGLFRRQQP